MISISDRNKFQDQLGRMACTTPDISKFNCNYFNYMVSRVTIGDTQPELSLVMNGKTCQVSEIETLSLNAQMIQNCDCSDPYNYNFYDEGRFYSKNPVIPLCGIYNLCYKSIESAFFLVFILFSKS